MDRVYLDMCSLKRPFDDQRQPRVREEATAVAAIVAWAETGEIALVRSPAHLVENDANPREDRRLAAALWIDGAAVDVPLDAEVEGRAAEPEALWFVTCDDGVLKLAGRLGGALRTLAVAPPALIRRSQS